VFNSAFSGQRVAAAVGLLIASIEGGGMAHAQGKLDARYTVTLAGIPIGRGAWVIDIGDDQYTAAASGATSGVLRVFSHGSGTSAARGLITGGQPVPGSYASSITSGKKTDEVRMGLTQGNVKDVALDPLPSPNPDRVPVTDAHRRGVVDPMTAALVRVPGNGEVLSPETCQRSAAIFDGRMRYDLKLAFKRMDRAKAERGYDGPAAVCSVSFTPVAGHIPGRAAIKYLSNLQDMELWLVPVAGTRIVVPFRFSLPTPLGTGVLQATQFVSSAQPAGRPTAAKTH